MAEAVWAWSAGAGVTSVARWRRRVTTDKTGSSASGSGRAETFSSSPHRDSQREGRGWEVDSGESRRELGHCGKGRESSGGGWLLVLVLTCTFANFCSPSVC
jgi:hypothetical protein